MIRLQTIITFISLCNMLKKEIFILYFIFDKRLLKEEELNNNFIAKKKYGKWENN